MQTRHLTKYLIVLLISLFSITAIIGCGASSSKKPVLMKIEVTPLDTDLPYGIEKQCTATAIYSDNSTKNITDLVVWSSNSDAVSVSDSGLMTGITFGESATITATDSPSGIEGNLVVTVTDIILTEIQISPEIAILAIGTSIQYTATGIFSDNSNRDLSSQVTWLSDNETAATIDDWGLLSGIDEGIVKVTAELNDTLATTNVEIKACTLQGIDVTPENASIPKGLSQAFIAMATYTTDEGVITHEQDVTELATWTSSVPDIAVVDRGIANSFTELPETGDVVITAEFNGEINTGSLIVTEATLQSIVVTTEDENTSVPWGNTIKFQATGIFSDGAEVNVTEREDVVWSSSDDNIVTISNAAENKGTAITTGIGNAVITVIHGVESEGGIKGEFELTVTDAILVSIAITADTGTSAPAGLPVIFTATGTYTNTTEVYITDQVTWSVENNDIDNVNVLATIENADGIKGHATTIDAGVVTVTATTPNVTPIEGTLAFEITPAELMEIILLPDNPTIVEGFTQQMIARGIFTNGERDITTEVDWFSNDTDAVNIKNISGEEGLISATNVATEVEITATYNGEPKIEGLLPGTSLVTVVEAELVSITIEPVDLQPLSSGLTRQFSAIGTFTSTSGTHLLDITQEVDWRSSNINIADIDTNGLAIGIAAGETTIIAEYSQPGDNITSDAELTIIEEE